MSAIMSASTENGRPAKKPSRHRRKKDDSDKSQSQPKARRCGTCENCSKADCRECVNCLDMAKYGGRGVLKKACLVRQCMVKMRVPKEKDTASPNKQARVIRSKKEQVGVYINSGQKDIRIYQYQSPDNSQFSKKQLHVIRASEGKDRIYPQFLLRLKPQQQAESPEAVADLARGGAGGVAQAKQQVVRPTTPMSRNKEAIEELDKNTNLEEFMESYLQAGSDVLATNGTGCSRCLDGKCPSCLALSNDLSIGRNGAGAYPKDLTTVHVLAVKPGDNYCGMEANNNRRLQQQQGVRSFGAGGRVVNVSAATPVEGGKPLHMGRVGAPISVGGNSIKLSIPKEADKIVYSQPRQSAVHGGPPPPPLSSTVANIPSFDLGSGDSWSSSAATSPAPSEQSLNSVGESDFMGGNRFDELFNDCFNHDYYYDAKNVDMEGVTYGGADVMQSNCLTRDCSQSDGHCVTGLPPSTDYHHARMLADLGFEVLVGT